MNNKRLLMLLGGEWHDFQGFAQSMTPVLEADGYQVERSWDPGRLLSLHQEEWRALLMYTCFTREQGQHSLSGLTEEQSVALARWVHAGGALLALHAATVLGTSGAAYRALLGGEFQSHPPPFSFTVYPLAHPHPILEGVTAFTIHDEFYIQTYDADVLVHLIAIYGNTAYPMAWSKEVGRGRVAYLAPGHFPAVWEHEAYRRLVLQVLGWLSGG